MNRGGGGRGTERTDKVKICIDGERVARWLNHRSSHEDDDVCPLPVSFSLFNALSKLCRLSRCCCPDVCHISSHFPVNPSLKNNKERKKEKKKNMSTNRYSHDTNASVQTCPTNPTRERETQSRRSVLLLGSSPRF